MLRLSRVGLWACFAFLAVFVSGDIRPLLAEEGIRSAPLLEMAFCAELSKQDNLRDALIDQVLSEDPDNAKARGLAGHVRDGSDWAEPCSVERSRKSDKLLQEYAQRREACGEDAASRLRLANWCRDHHMTDRERFHLTELVVRHGADPAVMSRLQMIKFRGRWIPKESLDEIRRLDDRQRRLEKKWKPLFAEWKDDLKADNEAAYKKFAERLAIVTEGDALPILEDSLSPHSEKAALAVVGQLDTMPLQQATESLVRHALFSEFETVRTAAAEALKKRPMYNCVPMLLDYMVAPVEVTVELPHEGTNYVRRTAVQRGADFDVKTVDHQLQYAVRARLSNNPTGEALAPRLPFSLLPGSHVEIDSEQESKNRRICETLYLLTGEQYHTLREWSDWWYDHVDSYSREQDRPTYERQRYRQSWAYALTISRDVGRARVVGRARDGHSCLAAGTPIVTEIGSRPVEEILPGDKVLAQDPDTGELDYKVVLQRTVRRLGEMRKVSMGNDSITVTVGHPFWVVGKGWQMAKELEVGQRVRSLGDSCEITAIETLSQDVAYNLVVDDFATYFCGDSRVLLHDNTLPKPTGAILPGFVPAAL